jgi:uncharacterized protein YhhL (DUF1145 family)
VAAQTKPAQVWVLNKVLPMPYEAALGLILAAVAIALVVAGMMLFVTGARCRATRPRLARVRIVGGIIALALGAMVLLG